MAFNYPLVLVILFLILLNTIHGLTPTVRITGEWVACTGRPGVCINTSAYGCSTAVVSSVCPGPAEIKCCPRPGGVTSGSCLSERIGLCTRTEQCTGTSVSGKCPGPSGITCCSESGSSSCPAVSSSCTLGVTTSCSTIVACKLTEQLKDEYGSGLEKLDDTLVNCNPPCVPYLQASAKLALEAAARKMEEKITLNSAYRSSAQQFLLRRMFEEGQRCKVRAAAKPGTSNHEGGLGIDIPSVNVPFWQSALTAEGFKWLGSRDPPHFDYVGAGADRSTRANSLIAFQTIWNLNNPTDTIADDGIWGPTTRARMEKTPCQGW